MRALWPRLWYLSAAIAFGGSALSAAHGEFGILGFMWRLSGIAPSDAPYFVAISLGLMFYALAKATEERS